MKSSTVMSRGRALRSFNTFNFVVGLIFQDFNIILCMMCVVIHMTPHSWLGQRKICENPSISTWVGVELRIPLSTESSHLPGVGVPDIQATASQGPMLISCFLAHLQRVT